MPTGTFELGRQRYRSDDGKVCIEINLKNSKQLFDQRDPSPFFDRDLDDDAVEYIVSSAEEISENRDLKLLIYLSDEYGDSMQESLGRQDQVHSNEIKQAIQGFFAYKAGLLRRQLNETNVRGRIFLVFGTFFLVVCLSVAEFAKMIQWSQLRTILSEGLVITGWVAMWRPLETFLYDRWPIRRKLRLYQKLANTEILVMFT